ncbi:TPA: hypothetical protein PD221_002463 [Staphylococcus aureus]|nr:hypothetical protein [Staphylococcus aureus]HDE8468244.1 hypothetical protein [Staphylococcus aureus]HDE8484746.1 hypothetical protein [Staphylococcus aureus]HDE8487426.1 hypothetical protein [Staphylococcus aureus]HDE8490303.1 hypothetical protein [Staphylococcus aureus]
MNDNKKKYESQTNRCNVKVYKKTDEIASELKFELRVKTKQEVYDIAIEKLYEQITGKKYE